MRTSICSRTGCFDRPSPFIDLALDEIAQVFGRPALGSNQIDPHLVEPGAYSRRIHRLDRGIVQLLDDRQRRALRQEEGAPTGYIDVGNADEKIFRRLPLSPPKTLKPFGIVIVKNRSLSPPAELFKSCAQARGDRREVSHLFEREPNVGRMSSTSAALTNMRAPPCSVPTLRLRCLIVLS